MQKFLILALCLALTVFMPGCSESDNGESEPSSSTPPDNPFSDPSGNSTDEPGGNSGGNHQSGVVARYDDWNLILVSGRHPLEEELSVELATVADPYQVDARILEPLQQMLFDARAAGYSLQVISAYRPFSSSERLYGNKVQEYLSAGYDQASAEAEAAKWVAPPGHSEHNTGLAVDIVSDGYFLQYDDLYEAFAEFDEAKWMKENCHKYGFILRYPRGKEDITGINFEPWHFRYVGVEHACVIMAQEFTLEEYLIQYGR